MCAPGSFCVPWLFHQRLISSVNNGVDSVEEVHAQPLHFCPLCLRKLQLAFGCDLMKRFVVSLGKPVLIRFLVSSEQKLAVF